MKKIFKTVLVLNLITGVIAVILRMNFDYFAKVNLVDFISFIGIFFWIVGGVGLIGNTRYKSSRKLDFTPDFKYENKGYYFTFLMFICGIPSIVTGIIFFIIQQ